MAAPPDGNPPVAVAIVPKTFREHYLIETNDPFRGRYDSIFALFAANTPNPTSSDTILESLVQTDISTPKTLIGLFQDGRDTAGLSLVFNGIHKMPNTLGTPTQWDGKVLMLAGEVVNGQIASVEFPSTGFFIPNNEAYETVPDAPEKVDEVLTSNPTAPLIAHIPEGTANTIKIRTRYLMYVPPRYVPIVVHRRLNPRQLWDELVGAIRANNEVESCKELVNWVLVALMQSGRGLPSTLVAARPTLSLIPDEVYFRRQQEILHAQLPGLTSIAPPSASGESAVTTQLATFVGQLVEEHRLARADTRERADEKRSPKTPTAYWGEEACVFLCTMCEVDSEDLLPSVWTLIAAAGKRDRIAVENAILATARRLQLVESAPLVTPEFAKKLTNLQLAGTDVDNLAEGLQPFALLVPDHGTILNNHNKQAVRDARQLMDEYDLMTDGSVNTSLADAKTIRTPSSGQRLITDLSHLRTVLEAMDVVLHTVLGPQHSVTANYDIFLNTYCKRENYFKARLNTLHVEYAPSRLLRYVQIRLINWFRTIRAMGDRQPAPEFLPVLTNLDNCETFWIPTLPMQYGSPPNAITSFDAPTASSRTVSVGPPSTITAPSGVSASSTTSTTAPSSTTASTSSRRVTVINATKNPLFEALKDQLSRGKINTAIKQHGPPPTITHNGVPIQMCASYHLRGVCWSSCPRAADHVAHSASDDEALLSWCTKALAAPPSA